MADIWRCKFSWTGGAIGSGTSTFYNDASLSAQSFATAASTFMIAATKRASNGDALPAGVKVSQDNTVDRIDPVSGILTDQEVITPGVAITGVGTGGYAAPAGVCVTWNSGDFVNGRRVRGRTFIIPLAQSCLDVAGTIDDTYRTAVINAAANLIATSTGLVVWHRPNPKGTNTGVAHFVTAAHVTDRAAILRSRR